MINEEVSGRTKIILLVFAIGLISVLALLVRQEQATVFDSDTSVIVTHIKADLTTTPVPAIQK